MTALFLLGCRTVDETPRHTIERMGRACFWAVRKGDNRIVAACKTKRSAAEAARRSEREIDALRAA
jgi:hypothetical protein